LYVVRPNGVLSAFEARSGARVYQQRLGSGTSAFTASPVANNGRIYFTSEEGDVYVVKAGRDFALVGTNRLDAVTLASPAISEGRMFFRTKDHVMAFGK
jgi:outer membrane protein assembly factor BamB